VAEEISTRAADGGNEAAAPGERLARRFRRLARSMQNRLKDVRGSLRSFERRVRLTFRPHKAKLPPALLSPEDPADYARWIADNDTLTALDRALIRDHIAAFSAAPTFSIVVSAGRADPAALDRTIASVRAQLYVRFELIVAGDAARASTDGRVRFLEATGDPAAFNAGLAAATGDWIVPLTPGDALAEHALYLLADAILPCPGAAIVYSDEDEADASGRRARPFFKPDFDPDFALGRDLFGRLAAFRSDLVRAAGGLRPGFGAAAERDLALRVLDAAPEVAVRHVPFVLCHRPVGGGGPAADAAEAARRAVADHLLRTGETAEALAGAHGSVRVRRSLPDPAPLVSIVIPTRNRPDLLGPCLDGLFNRTDYRPLEIVIVDNGSDEAEALALLGAARARPNVRLVEDRGAFNFSRLVNRGVAETSGDIVVLLNNDIDVIGPDWLAEMVGLVLRPEVGVVGAKLYYADDTIQHAGVILGINGRAGHEHKRVPRSASGPGGRLDVARATSCVTGACFAVRRDVYDALGGFNERDLAVGFNDVDFCIRAGLAGYRVLWTPHAELYHYESVSRGRATATPEGTARHRAEAGYLRRQWGQVLDADRFYNPNLTLESVPFKLAAASRARKPWLDFAATRPPRHGTAPGDASPLDWSGGRSRTGAV
jgi:GT2 family glycosyltransferase